MMPSLGAKKKDGGSRAERADAGFPQLSNEMQLSIMNKVKNGELSIEDALDEARRDASTQAEEGQSCQYNFSVLKHGRYRWQKRVLQFDFTTQMLCMIEKGIVKQQLTFSTVKSCDDDEGSRFSVSFRGHHDYELEATSLEDKHQMMQLVNKIIYGNIYSEPAGGHGEPTKESPASRSLRDGILLLHRGGLASFKWVKYEARLHPGQLTLVPFSRRGAADGEVTSLTSASHVIHLSDGDTSVTKNASSDAFTLKTHKNEYQFKVPVSNEASTPGPVHRERDSWVQAIARLCSDWKRRSEHLFPDTMALHHLSITEVAEDTDTDPESGGGGGNQGAVHENTDPSNDAGDPEPRDETGDSGANASPVQPSSAFPPTPPITETANPEPQPTWNIPPPPPIPPPLSSHFKLMLSPRKPTTKAFHWDVISADKIAKSMWAQSHGRRIELDTTRLYDQFAVKPTVKFAAVEAGSSSQNIMLNQKIAHNFNIFLKSLPVQPGELKDKLFIVNEEDGGLSDEHITALRRYVPTLEDVEMYKSYKGSVSELHIVDQYMWEMCSLPYLSTQLDLLLTLRELPVGISDLQPLIGQKMRMCTQLHGCDAFVSVLEYLLAVGNYLNENAGKGKAKGFRLSSLAKLPQLRGRNRKFTLLHALVEQLMLREPNLASFTQELDEFETVPGASIKGLTAEIDVLKNALQKLTHYAKTFNKKNAGRHHASFSKDLKAAIERYNGDLAALTKTCEEMKRLYSVILVKFGEPADRDSQELFGLISGFIQDFRMALAQIS